MERELDKSATTAAAAANSSLIRRFNHHSTMVLKAADKHGTMQVKETDIVIRSKKEPRVKNLFDVDETALMDFFQMSAIPVVIHSFLWIYFR